MSLVTLIKVSLTFLERKLFDEIGLQVEHGDRIGLVGRNGSGKTTLLRVIMGEISPDSGEIRIAKGSRIGYLKQDVQERSSGALLQSVIESIPGRTGLASELEQIERSLKTASDKKRQADLAEKIAEIIQETNRLELEFPRHEAEKILLGLGFRTDDFERPVSSLSGGWKMRAALAGLLYQRPDLLLLDEPTNHLDVPSVRWLEQFLDGFRGGMILISHDREFLNRQVQRIISFESEGMRSYSGNYDYYIKAREEEKGSLEAKARNQEQKIRDARKFIDRFRSKATKARQAQSKLKLVRKMELIKTDRKEKTLSFTFPDVPKSGRDMLSIKGISKSFGKSTLYKGLELSVLRGERIAIIGPNGCGKTTLLRVIAGELAPDEGKVELGHEVRLAYFAQHHSDILDPKKTVVEEVYRVVPDVGIGFVRSVCGAFLFSGGDVDKAIGVLSGGEKARVSLAKLLVKPGNLTLMDEPTNHLDIESSETLINALTGYSGTLLFVSHNQSFVNRLATKIWDITGQGVVEYPGNLDEYYDHLSRMAGPLEGKGEGQPTGQQYGPFLAESKGWKSSNNRRRSRKQVKREEAEQRRLVHDTLKPIQIELEATEERITKLESRQKEVEKSLADPEIFRNRSQSDLLLKEYRDVRKELEDLLLKWEACQDRLESAKTDLEKFRHGSE